MTDQLADDLDDVESEQPSFDASAPGSTAEEAAVETESGFESDADAPASGRRKRVSKWDRPPDPHDWRFFVGNLGKILIATGVLLFGFVAYQLWGTGIETARAQNRLEGEFAALLAEFDDADADEPASAGNDPTVRPTEPDAGTGGDTVDTPDDDPATDTPTDGDDLDGAADAIEISSAIPGAVDLSDEAVVQDPLPQPVRGDPLFRLEIPAIDRDDIVVAGVSLDDLKDGPGHYPDTPLPGQLGNASVAGHRTTYGAPFFNVDQLEAGDELITTLANGDRFVYEVTFVEIVTAADYWVVTTRDPDIAEFTLTSCHPKYTARDRIVVHSVLNVEKSSNVGFPTFYELEPDDTPIPGDDPVMVASDIEITEAGDATSGTASDADVEDAPTVPADEAAEADDPAAAAGGDDATGGDDTATAATPAAPSELDAFSRGWFDDDGAWLHIALWGLLLTAISLLAYQLSKKTRHDSIGFLVGIGPFLFGLYFFFQNVHRLLPPGI